MRHGIDKATRRAYGDDLRTWRRATKRSQRQLAAALGVSFTSIANWETGRHLPVPAQRALLAALGFSTTVAIPGPSVHGRAVGVSASCYDLVTRAAEARGMSRAGLVEAACASLDGVDVTALRARSYHRDQPA